MYHSCMCAIPFGVDGSTGLGSGVDVEGPGLFSKYIMGFMGAGWGMGCMGVGVEPCDGRIAVAGVSLTSKWTQMIQLRC